MTVERAAVCSPLSTVIFLPADTYVHIDLVRRDYLMLWTIFVILLIMWLLGMVTSYTLGGFIHILLIVALVAAVIQLISGRRAL